MHALVKQAVQFKPDFSPMPYNCDLQVALTHFEGKDQAGNSVEPVKYMMFCWITPTGIVWNWLRPDQIPFVYEALGMAMAELGLSNASKLVVADATALNQLNRNGSSPFHKKV